MGSISGNAVMRQVRVEFARLIQFARLKAWKVRRFPALILTIPQPVDHATLNLRERGYATSESRIRATHSVCATEGMESQTLSCVNSYHSATCRSRDAQTLREVVVDLLTILTGRCNRSRTIGVCCYSGHAKTPSLLSPPRSTCRCPSQALRVGGSRSLDRQRPSKRTAAPATP